MAFGRASGGAAATITCPVDQGLQGQAAWRAKTANGSCILSGHTSRTLVDVLHHDVDRLVTVALPHARAEGGVPCAETVALWL